MGRVLKVKNWAIENKEIIIFGVVVGTVAVGLGYLIKIDNENARIAWAEGEAAREELARNINEAIEAERNLGAVFYPIEAAIGES